jgi:DNA ligase-1
MLQEADPMSDNDQEPADLDDGESAEVKGSGSSVYTLRNTGGVYSCSCPAWRNQSIGIERRTCKHLRRYRGDAAEQARLGSTDLLPLPAARRVAGGAGGASAGGASGDGGELTQEPPLLLAHKWDSQEDLAGWWLSEKLDGVRAYWDGRHFLSRLGNPFLAPDWFTAGLPATPLDGELWAGRKAFQRTVSVVRRQDRGREWESIRYVVFDAPSHGGAFEERIDHCRSTLGAAGSRFVSVHDHVRCEGVEHLRRELTRVESLGGEGLMLRRPGSRYEVGRSTSLLKVKSFHDAEAVVVEHLAGAGKHKGRLGALQLQMPDGTCFSVGTGFSDAERADPPPLGALVTYRYQELSPAGVPRFPTFVAVRHDLRAAPPAPRPAAVPAPTAAASVAPRVVPAPAVQPAPAGPPAPAPAAGMRRFELVEGTASKFWEITLLGQSFITRYGRLGAQGQKTLKEYGTAAEASREHDKLVAEKVKKGYRAV